MKPVYTFLLHHGLVIMLGGFAISVIDLIVYIQTRFYGNATPRIAFAGVWTGLGIYVIGRVLVSLERRNRKKNPPPADEL